MPPKKKKGKKGKKKKKDDATLELEDNYKRTMDEIEALKDHLATRKEFTRRAQSAYGDMKKRMVDTELQLEEHRSDQKAINADMSRQYKTMQTEMMLRTHHLEQDLLATKQKLSQTEMELKKTKEEKDKMEKEKDDEIEMLKHKIMSMEVAYDGILNEAMDSLISKIDNAKDKWEEKATLIQAKNKQVLLEFGLNPLDI